MYSLRRLQTKDHSLSTYIYLLPILTSTLVLACTIYLPSAGVYLNQETKLQSPTASLVPWFLHSQLSYIHLFQQHTCLEYFLKLKTLVLCQNLKLTISSAYTHETQILPSCRTSNDICL